VRDAGEVMSDGVKGIAVTLKVADIRPTTRCKNTIFEQSPRSNSELVLFHGSSPLRQ
jgi:hypothetical protein